MIQQQILQQTLELLQAGEYQQAEKLIKPCAQQHPDDAASQQYLGLALLLQNKPQPARPYLLGAIELQAGNAQYQCNFGECLRQLGEFGLAETHLRKAISIRPDYTDASYNLACTLLQTENYKETRSLLRQLLGKSPNSSRYLCAYADLLREVGQQNAAMAHYKKALKNNPDYAPAHSNLGPLLLAKGEIDGALEHCRRAVELAPEKGLCHLNLGRCLAKLEQLDQAMEAYADAYELIPQSLLLLTCIGSAWLEVNDLRQAEYWFMLALEQDQNSIIAKCGLADAHREAGLLDQAINTLNEVLEDNPKAAPAYQSRAKAFLDIGDVKSSISDYQQLLALRPQQANIHAALGQTLENAGDLQAAETEFRLALQKNPGCVPALRGLATTKKANLAATDVTQMHKLIEHKELRDGAKAALHSGLGYYYDGIKNYSKAAEHVNLGNQHFWLAKSRKGWSYNPNDFRHKVDQIIATFNAEYFARLRTKGSQSQLPAFIVGMPRSGTTLTEQILNAHPEILGIGERNHLGEALTRVPAVLGQQHKGSPIKLVPQLSETHLKLISDGLLTQLDSLLSRSNKAGVQRIVDKMPDNYLHLGWLLTLFPQARIIHARRDVRDIAVSCWMTQFGKIRWAFDLQHLAERIVQYDRLMKHWRSVLPGKFMEADYEAIVMDQETHSRKLIEYLGLEWDPACLNFYQQETVVRTASVTQVRQAIYKRSLHRWQRYTSALEPLLERLEAAGVDISTG